jgi:hypothetical protein
MIKIISSEKVPSSLLISSVALCNALNDKDLPSIFYGLDNWHTDKCVSAPLSNFRVRKGDIIITVGFAANSYEDLFCVNKKLRGLYSLRRKKFTRTLKAKLRNIYYYLKGFYYLKIKGAKLIFSCNEDGNFDFNKISKIYDKVHFSDDSLVSNAKNYFICPNISQKEIISSVSEKEKIAAIVGGICDSGGILESINKALKDGAQEILIYGFMKDPVYFYSKIETLMKEHSGKIKLVGFVANYNEIIGSARDVYCLPNKKIVSDLECYFEGSNVVFHSNNNLIKSKYLDKDKIVGIWSTEFQNLK